MRAMAKSPRNSKATKAAVAADDDAGLLGASTSAAASPRPSATVTQDGVVELPAFKRLGEIVGQRHAATVLRSSIDTGRVHHAWIFSGPRGVGKFTTARAFAAELLSRAETGVMAPETAEEIIGLVASARHSDVHVVSKELASVSREKTVRDSKQTTVAKAVIEEFLLEPAARTRAMSHLTRGLCAKVFIIDEAELMDTGTQNQVLKTLEEPPEGTVIILVTSDEAGLLPTVRSRCQRVGFGSLGEREMQEWMHTSGIALDPEQSPWLLRFAGGSPGGAMLALKNDLYAWHTALEPLLSAIDRGQGASVAGKLGATMTKLVEERAAQAVAGNPEASKAIANRFWTDRMLSLLGERSRGHLRRAVDREAMSRAVLMIELVRQAEVQVDRNVQFAAAFDNLAAQMLTPSPGVAAMMGAGSA
jgi:DNA polymerase-3 subunit delta'